MTCQDLKISRIELLTTCQLCTIQLTNWIMVPKDPEFTRLTSSRGLHNGGVFTDVYGLRAIGLISI